MQVVKIHQDTSPENDYLVARFRGRIYFLLSIDIRKCITMHVPWYWGPC
jgi:hypothetical protein